MHESALNYLDVAIAALLTVMFVKGLVRGLFRESVGLLGLIAAFLIAMRFLRVAAGLVDSVLHLSPMANALIGFILVLSLSLTAFQLLANLLHKAVQKTALNWIERLAGGAVGFLKGAIIVSLLALLLNYLPFTGQLKGQTENSVLFDPAQRFAPWVFDRLRRLAPGAKSFYEQLRDSVGPSLLSPAQEALRGTDPDAGRPQRADSSK